MDFGIGTMKQPGLVNYKENADLFILTNIPGFTANFTPSNPYNHGPDKIEPNHIQIISYNNNKNLKKDHDSNYSKVHSIK